MVLFIFTALGSALVLMMLVWPLSALLWPSLMRLMARLELRRLADGRSVVRDQRLQVPDLAALSGVVLLLPWIQFVP